MKPKASIAVLFVTIFTILGCGTSRFKKSKEFSHQDQAGSVHVSVVSVGHFEDYLEALSPKFDLSFKDALEKAVPTTRTYIEKIVSSIQAQVSVKTGGADNSSDPEAPSPLDRKAADLAGATDILDPDKLQPEPFMQYQAATALGQEVALLERYVRDAMVKDKGQAYVVRLQIQVTPYARYEPYDVHMRVGFFEATKSAEGVFTSENQSTRTADREKLLETRMTARTILEGLDSPINVNPDREIDSTNRVSNGHCRVIPLFVTDAYESSLGNQTIDTITQLSIAASILGGTTQIGLGSTFFEEHLTSVLGREVNNLLSVGRLGENAINIRVGALQGVVSDYELIPRNYFVTVLLVADDYKRFDKDDEDEKDGLQRFSIVQGDSAKTDSYGQVNGGNKNDPRAQPACFIEGWSEFRHAQTGVPILRRDQQHSDQLYDAIAEDLGIVDPLDCEVGRRRLRRLRQLAINNDHSSFHTYFAALPIREEVLDRTGGCRNLWVRLLSLQNGSHTFATPFELPIKEERVLDLDQLLALDDGQVLSTIMSGSQLTANAARWKARVTFKDTKGKQQVAVLPAILAQTSANQTQLELRFRSLAALGIMKPDVEIMAVGGSKPIKCSYWLKPKKPVLVRSEVIDPKLSVDANGKATCRLELEFLKGCDTSKVEISIEQGARLEGASRGFDVKKKILSIDPATVGSLPRIVSIDLLLAGVAKSEAVIFVVNHAGENIMKQVVMSGD